MASPDDRMTWGEFKAWVEDKVQVTDEPPMGYIDVGTVTFRRDHAGVIEAEINGRGELCIRSGDE